MEVLLTLFAIAGIFILLLLFLRVTQLNERVSWLERKLDDVIRESARTPQPAQPPPPPEYVQPQQPAPVEQRPPVPAAIPHPSFPPTAPARPMPPKEPSRTREEFEAFVGGKLLDRIGALALVMGVGFF